MKKLFPRTLTSTIIRGFSQATARYLLVTILPFLILSQQVLSQERMIPDHFWKENGLPYIRNISPKEYGEHPQNWSIIQDKRGVMYFGNNHGLLIYDGVSWRLVKTNNESIVRSLCVQGDVIYYGGKGELGYLETNEIGELSSVSLLDKIPEEQRDSKDVWSIEAAQNSIIFRTVKYLYRWSDNEMQVLKADQEFLTTSVLDDTFYVYGYGSGLMKLSGDSLQRIPGSELFAQELALRRPILPMLPFGEQRLLLGPGKKGLLIYDGRELATITTPVNDFLIENVFYHGARLQHDLFALATVRGGVMIIDKKGNICQILNKSTGLRDDHINYVFVDRQGALWIALDNGLARVETPSPLSRFSAASGLETMVSAIIRHEGTLYVGTQQGIYYLDKRASGSLAYPEFKPVTESLRFCWSFLSVGDRLLVGSQQGAAEITNKQAVLIDADNPESRGTTHLHRSLVDTSMVFASQITGLTVFQLKEGEWRNIGKLPDVREYVFSMAEDNQGVLWLGTSVEGLIRVEFTKGPAAIDSTKINITRFGTEHGLTKNLIVPFWVAGRMRFATQKGLRYFDDPNQRFPLDPTFGQTFADSSRWIYQINEDVDRNVWFVAGVGKTPINGAAIAQADGSYLWKETPFLRLNDIGIMNVIYPEPDNVVWFGGSEGIARYHGSAVKNYFLDYPAVIRRVVGITSDSLFYNGNPSLNDDTPSLDYGLNSLRFEFSAPSYDDVSANQFQFMLDGFDEAWSNWSSETRKDYTGLREGSYVFRVRARNIYRSQSQEAVYAFSVLPPWYRSWWAYLIYGMLAVGMIALVVKSRVRQYQNRTRELEAIVDARTTTIREQAEKLKELDQVKSRFFANISHEFRTPMTLILGPLEDMIKKSNSQTQQEELGLMRRNAKRVLHLINQLLDLSSLESQKFKLSVRQGDLADFLKGITMSFASLAERKNIALNFAGGASIPRVHFDPDLIEKILYNLLSNAFKFTPNGGRITVDFHQKSGKNSDPQYVVIKVSDTGIGIPENRLNHIFDRFYQIDATETREQEGSGIGLALTRELVDLHRGEIEVSSVEGRGTEFSVILPVGEELFSEDEFDSSLEVISRSRLELPEEISTERAVEPGEEVTEESPVILVVDDHGDVRSYIRMHLQEKYQIIEADNGETGMKQAFETIPDLIISDVMMPKMNGYQLSEALKKNEKTSHIPVILLTARAGEQDKVEGLETGADDYLTKPFNSKELHVRVDNLIQLRKKLQERYRKEGLLQPRDIAIPSAEESFLQKLMNAVEENLEDEEFGVENLSAALFMSRRQLQRKIRALTGESPRDFIRSVRLQRAKQLLEQGAGTVSEIAFMTGFSSLPHFSTTFREKFGKSPSEIKAR